MCTPAVAQRSNGVGSNGVGTSTHTWQRLTRDGRFSLLAYVMLLVLVACSVGCRGDGSLEGQISVSVEYEVKDGVEPFDRPMTLIETVTYYFTDSSTDRKLRLVIPESAEMVGINRDDLREQVGPGHTYRVAGDLEGETLTAKRLELVEAPDVRDRMARLRRLREASCREDQVAVLREFAETGDSTIAHILSEDGVPSAVEVTRHGASYEARLYYPAKRMSCLIQSEDGMWQSMGWQPIEMPKEWSDLWAIKAPIESVPIELQKSWKGCFDTEDTEKRVRDCMEVRGYRWADGWAESWWEIKAPPQTAASGLKNDWRYCFDTKDTENLVRDCMEVRGYRWADGWQLR